MQLKEIQGKSKKTGKNYTGYCVKIGEYETPMFFPSKIEILYIKNYLKKSAHAAFRAGDDDEEELDVDEREDDDEI